MVKLNDTEMMRDIDDKFKALLTDFYENLNKSKRLEQKSKSGEVSEQNDESGGDDGGTDFINQDFSDDYDEVEHTEGFSDYVESTVKSRSPSTPGEFERLSISSEEERKVPSAPNLIGPSPKGTLGEAVQESEESIMTQEESVVAPKVTSRTPREATNKVEHKPQYSAGDMVKKLEEGLTVKEDVTEHFNYYRNRSSNSNLEKVQSAENDFSDDDDNASYSMYSSVSKAKKKKKRKTGRVKINENVSLKSKHSVHELLPKRSMTISNISKKTRKKKRKVILEKEHSINWINYNRNNLRKITKKGPEGPPASQPIRDLKRKKILNDSKINETKITDPKVNDKKERKEIIKPINKRIEKIPEKEKIIEKEKPIEKETEKILTNVQNYTNKINEPEKGKPVQKIEKQIKPTLRTAEKEKTKLPLKQTKPNEIENKNQLKNNQKIEDKEKSKYAANPFAKVNGQREINKLKSEQVILLDKKDEPLALKKVMTETQLNNNNNNNQLMKNFTKSHSKCLIRQVTPSDMKMDSVAEIDEVFNAIPFIVGQSINKTYHLGLSFQQAMSMMKRLATHKEMIVTPLGCCPAAEQQQQHGGTGTEGGGSRCASKCEALEWTREDEDWDDNPWDLYRHRNKPKCTCLPESKNTSTLKKVLQQLAMKPDWRNSNFSNSTIDKDYSEEYGSSKNCLRKANAQSRTELLRNIQSIQFYLATNANV